MPTSAEIAAAATQFITASGKAHSIVNGPASGTGSTVPTTSGDIPTHAKQAADFATANAAAIAAFNSAGTSAIDTFTTNGDDALAEFAAGQGPAVVALFAATGEGAGLHSLNLNQAGGSSGVLVIWSDSGFYATLSVSVLLEENLDISLPMSSGTLAIVDDPYGIISSASISDATNAATPNMICKRSPQGALSLAGTAGPALDAYSSGASAITGQSANSAAIHGTTTAAGAGLLGQSDSGYGSDSQSNTGTGARCVSGSGTYHAHFGEETGNNRSAIERVRGWLVWFYNGFIGRLKTENITAARDWTLPDKSGIVAILPAYADSTAANAAVSVGDSWYDTTLKKVRVRLS